MIWSFALPDGRVIEILWSEESKKFYTDALQPVLPQVSLEVLKFERLFHPKMALHLKVSSIRRAKPPDQKCLTNSQASKKF
jgi:hypothetical protein